MGDLTDSSDSIQTFSAGRTKYTLALLVLVSFFNALDQSVLIALLEPIKHDFQLSDLQLGLVSGFAFSLCYATLAIPFARWADLGNRRTLLTFTVGLWSIMTALSGLAQNFLQLFFSRVGVGIGEAGGGPAAFAMLGDLYSPERRGGVTALFIIGGILGGAIGIGGASVIAATWDWRVAFISLGLPGVVLAILLGTTLHEPRQHCKTPTLSDVMGRNVKQAIYFLFSKPAFLNSVIGFTLFNLFSLGGRSFSISYFIRSFGLPLEQIGPMFAVTSGVSIIAGTFLGGYIANRAGASNPRYFLMLPAVIFLIITPLFLVMYADVTIYVALVAYAIGSLLIGIVAPCIFVSIFGLSGENYRAMGVALMGFFTTLIGGGFGPFLIGALSDFLSAYSGDESLRWALLISTGFVPVAAFYLYRASTTLLEDLEEQ